MEHFNYFKVRCICYIGIEGKKTFFSPQEQWSISFGGWLHVKCSREQRSSEHSESSKILKICKKIQFLENCFDPENNLDFRFLGENFRIFWENQDFSRCFGILRCFPDFVVILRFFSDFRFFSKIENFSLFFDIFFFKLF